MGGRPHAGDRRAPHGRGDRSADTLAAREHLPRFEAIRAADLSLWIEPVAEREWPHRELRLGFDTQARLLQTVVLIFKSGESTVTLRCSPADSSGTSCPERTHLPLGACSVPARPWAFGKHETEPCP